MTKASKSIACLSLSILCALCLGFGLTPSAKQTVFAEEQAKITLKLNGGFHVTEFATDSTSATYSEEDVEYLVNKGEFTFTHANVRAMFGNMPVYSKPTANNATNFATTAEGYYHAPTNSGGGQIFTDLLFGVFEDLDSDGIVDDGETLYRSGDTIVINGDTTLTCYYSGQNAYESNDQLDRNTNVKLNKAWRNGFENALVYYTEKDLQPFYHTLVAIGNFGFSLDTYTGTIRGVELPNTVTSIGAKAFALTTRLEYVKGTENVRMYDNESFWAAGCDANASFRLEVAGPDNDVATYAFAFAKTNVEARILYTASNYYRRIGDNWRNGPQFTKDNSEKVSFEDPCVYAYVQYGKTEEMYISEDLYANSSMKAKYSEDANGVVTLTRVNTPVREMYKVSFNLDGGNVNGTTSIKNTYMDARAVSITREGAEANLTVTNDAGNLIRSYNPAEQTLSLLKAERPQDPTKDGYSFGGWMDQNGHIWTESDWNNGGYAYNYGSEGAILTAVWYDRAYVNLSLDGKIGVIYYFDKAGWDVNGANVEFTDADENLVDRVSANSGKTVNMNGREYYSYTIYVPAKDAGKVITASLVLSNGSVYESVSLSVNDYIDVILSNEQVYSKEQDVVKALKAYTAAANAYFAGETVEVANVDTSSLDATYNYAGALRGMNFLGTSLLLESDTTLRYYFTIDEGLTTDDFYILVQGVGRVEIQHDEVNNLYYFELANIVAADLDKVVRFEITYKAGTDFAEGSWIEGSALGYVNSVLQSEQSEDLKNLVKFLYDYSVKADAYFAK